MATVPRGEHLIEDVIVALAARNLDDARSLEQVGLAGRADDDGVGVVLHRDVLAEARRVVVADRLGVTECLEHWRGLA